MLTKNEFWYLRPAGCRSFLCIKAVGYWYWVAFFPESLRVFFASSFRRKGHTEEFRDINIIFKEFFPHCQYLAMWDFIIFDRNTNGSLKTEKNPAPKGIG